MTTLPKLHPSAPLYVRHHGDEYIDEVQIDSSYGLKVRASVVPRYKVSSASGSEWRTGVHVVVIERSTEVYARAFHRMETFAAALPWLLIEETRRASAERDDPTFVVMLRKGRKVYQRQWKTLHQAAVTFPWEWIVCEERDEDDPTGLQRLNETLDQSLCFQPGCAALAAAEYRLRDRFSREGYKADRSESLEYRRRFCLQHAMRGDCGLEDADRNYEKLGELGPEHARGYEGAVAPVETIIAEHPGDWTEPA